MRPSRITLFRRQHGRRILVALALVVSLGLLSYSITRLLGAQREATLVNGNIQRLTREIEQMDRELNSTNAPQTFEALRQEEQSLMLTSAGLADWTEQLRQQGVPLVLDVNAQAGAPFAGALAERGLKIVPVTVDLNPPKGILAVKPPYQRLLQFLHNLTQQTARVDLVELNVSAESGGIERASAVLNVWVGEAAPTVAAVKPAPTEGAKP